MAYHKWEPLSGLETSQLTGSLTALQELHSLQRQWREFRKQREDENPNAFTSFIEQLYRRFAIETGIIEGIYTIDRGTTETLVEKGLDAGIISPSSTNRDPDELIENLQDHQKAVEYVSDSIQRQVPLSKTAIRQMHIILTRSQKTFSAIDQFGNRVDMPLQHGTFKKWTNNPQREDGTTHEYCPPESVDPELDRLVDLYAHYSSESAQYDPLVVCAWLHHRFAQIHPFQDGNGRVARALQTWQLVKHHYLPIVISRDNREQYIQCLEEADAGDLNPLITLFVRLETRLILQALGEPTDAVEPTSSHSNNTMGQVLDYISERLHNRQESRLAQMRRVNDVAHGLQAAAQEWLQQQCLVIPQNLEESGVSVECGVDTGGPGDKEHWYRAEVIETGRDAGHWVNWTESRFFVQFRVSIQEQGLAPRLRFVISIHHVGRQLSGIMAATAFTVIDPGATAADESSGPDFHNCTTVPFTFTWQDRVGEPQARFAEWMDEQLAVALRYWAGFIPR